MGQPKWWVGGRGAGGLGRAKSSSDESDSSGEEEPLTFAQLTARLGYGQSK